MVERRLQAARLGGPDAAVERRPHHHPRVREVPLRTADLPDPVVGPLPVLGEIVDQGPLQPPRVAVDLQPGLTRLVEGDHHLTEHVHLPLVDRGVADPYRTRVLVAGQVVEGPLGQPAGAVDGVHHLQVLGVAGHRAQQPVAPQRGLLGVAGRDQRLERQRGVAQPAVAVVPVALAAEVLGQRRGRRGDDAAGPLVGEQPQGDERADHDVGVGYVDPALRRPLARRARWCGRCGRRG